MRNKWWQWSKYGSSWSNYRPTIAPYGLITDRQWRSNATTQLSTKQRWCFVLKQRWRFDSSHFLRGYDVSGKPEREQKLSIVSIADHFKSLSLIELSYTAIWSSKLCFGPWWSPTQALYRELEGFSLQVKAEVQEFSERTAAKSRDSSGA